MCRRKLNGDRGTGEKNFLPEISSKEGEKKLQNIKRSEINPSEADGLHKLSSYLGLQMETITAF